MAEFQSEEVELLKRLLKSIADGEGDDKAVKTIQEERANVNKKIASTVRLLYAASKIRIYKLADKIASSAVSKDEEVFTERSEVKIPVAESWDFRLGDKVRIKYGLRDFKSIQTRTLGWSAKLRTIHGCIGIITAQRSIFANALTVYTPARLASSSLYPGVLEKISPELDEDPVPSQWKVGQYVTIKMDLKVVNLLQRHLDNIPNRYLGRKGRIIAVTRVAVVVTFNEKESYDINSYLLVLCPDQSPIEKKERQHEDGFKVGEKVLMLSNFKKLVERQKGKGEWAENMSNIAGKKVTIVRIQKDGTIHVQYKYGRSWRVSADSVIKLDQVQPYGRENDIPFVRRDIVKIKMTENIRMLLESENVPMLFLEYLRNTAEVKLVDDDLDYLIRYNCDQNVSAYPETIRRATESEMERHMQIKTMVKNIAVGSQVYLDVGPPNFVTGVLREIEAPREVIRALTTKAKLVGFAEDDRAVIEFEDGSRYKVKKKFLTIPDKFNIQDPRGGIDYEAAKEIQLAVANCAEIVNDDQDRPSNVKILSMTYGSTSTVDLRVYSDSATAQKICETLPQVTDWDIELSGRGVFFIKKMASHPHEIKVCLYFNDDEYTPQSERKSLHPADTSARQVRAGTSGVEEQPAPQADPDDTLEDVTPDQFRYFRLYDRSLSRNVYFPYVVRGQRRPPQTDEEMPRDGNRSGGRILNISAEYVKEINISN